MNLHHEFKRSGLDLQLVAQLRQKIGDEKVDKAVEALVEQMVVADLRANPGLFHALTTDGDIDQTKVSRLFGPRMMGEIDHGLAGKPIEKFFKRNDTEFHCLIENMLASHQDDHGKH